MTSIALYSAAAAAALMYAQAVVKLKDSNVFEQIGGFRIECTVKAADWDLAVESMVNLFSKDPSDQLTWLLSGVVDMSDYETDKFTIFTKSVARDAYHQLCDNAFKIAVEWRLFTSGQSSAYCSEFKVMNMADLWNVFGFYGYDISKRYKVERITANKEKKRTDKQKLVNTISLTFTISIG